MAWQWQIRARSYRPVPLVRHSSKKKAYRAKYISKCTHHQYYTVENCTVLVMRASPVTCITGNHKQYCHHWEHCPDYLSLSEAPATVTSDASVEVNCFESSSLHTTIAAQWSCKARATPLVFVRDPGTSHRYCVEAVHSRVTHRRTQCVNQTVHLRSPDCKCGACRYPAISVSTVHVTNTPPCEKRRILSLQ